jgi:hypothetical protein
MDSQLAILLMFGSKANLRMQYDREREGARKDACDFSILENTICFVSFFPYA